MSADVPHTPLMTPGKPCHMSIYHFIAGLGKIISDIEKLSLATYRYLFFYRISERSEGCLNREARCEHHFRRVSNRVFSGGRVRSSDRQAAQVEEGQFQGWQL